MGVYLSEPQTSKNTKQDSGNGLKYCSSQMQGWRKTMQDADIHQLDIGDGNAVFGVFDGHGGIFKSLSIGHQVSKFVEQRFVNILKNCQNYKAKKYRQALEECFKKIDEVILSKQGQQKLRAARGLNPNDETQGRVSSATGCTANVILITKDSYYVANSGDSRSALARGQTCVQLSQDHKPQSIEQRTRIEKAGGSIVMGRVNGGLNLTRSFGDFDYKQNKDLPYDQQMITCKPDVKVFQRKKQDQFIIMGCDGIWEKYVDKSDGLVNLVRQQLKNKKQTDKVVQSLLDQLIAKQTKEGVGCDNMTAILILLNWPK